MSNRDGFVKDHPIGAELEKRGVNLIGNGSKRTAKCPFHDDHSPSFSVDLDAGLWKCHAGCGGGSVIDLIAKFEGRTAADVLRQGGQFPDPRPKATNGKPAKADKLIFKTICHYEYRDAAGNVIFRVTRRHAPCADKPSGYAKDFPSSHPDGKGGWAWGMGDVEPVLYRLPEILRDFGKGLPVFVCEGEKDAECLAEFKLTSTCNPQGAGKWLPAYTETLRGADVVLIPDRDQPGEKHTQAVATSLNGVAKRVRVLELPDVGGKFVKDASDFFALGGDISQFLCLVDTARDWTPEWKLGRSRFLSLVQDGVAIQREELPPVVEIVEGIVAECSKLSIVSSAKCFKTWTTIYLALAISSGVEFLGRATLRRRVLYVNLELKDKTFKRRLQSIARAMGIEIEAQWFSHIPLRGHLSGLSLRQIVSEIIATATTLGASVIVIDPLFKLNIEGEENSSRDQTIFCNELDRITTEGKCTAIFNDHAGKGNQSEKDPLDVIRGSSAKGGDLDAAMVLRKHEVDGCFRVDLVHRELPPVEPFVIGWNFPLMEIREDLDADKMKKAKGGQVKKHDPLKLLAVIQDTTAENPISISEWAKKANVQRTTLNDYLPELRTRGLIRTAGAGAQARQYISKNGLEAIKDHE